MEGATTVRSAASLDWPSHVWVLPAAHGRHARRPHQPTAAAPSSQPPRPLRHPALQPGWACQLASATQCARCITCHDVVAGQVPGILVKVALHQLAALRNQVRVWAGQKGRRSRAGQKGGCSRGGSSSSEPCALARGLYPRTLSSLPPMSRHARPTPQLHPRSTTLPNIPRPGAPMQFKRACNASHVSATYSCAQGSLLEAGTRLCELHSERLTSSRKMISASSTFTSLPAIVTMPTTPILEVPAGGGG